MLLRIADKIFIIVFTALVSSVVLAFDELSDAALKGDKEKLESLLDSGRQLKEGEGALSLNWAAVRGKHEVVELLISHGANVNSREPLNGLTPLHQAVSYSSDRRWRVGDNKPPMNIDDVKNKKIFSELLISHGANVNAQNNSGKTPLHMAGSKELAEFLIKHGANVNSKSKESFSSPLFEAAFDDLELVTVLLSHGAEANYINDSGLTPLHLAVRNNQIKIVEVLVKHGAEINVEDNNGDTPLRIAIENNNSQLVKFILSNGGKSSSNPKGGVTELHLAVSQNNKWIVEQLLAHGAKTTVKNSNGLTPMALAIRKNNFEIARLLIKSGADANVQDQNGTPLIFGIRNGELLELLLEHGANPNIKDAHGDSLLWHVCYDSKLSEVLLKNGADINIKNSQGRTVLHLASRFAHEDVVQWLLANGSNVSDVDAYYGQTPLFHAVRSFERHSYSNSSGALGGVTSYSDFSDESQKELSNNAASITPQDDLNNVFPLGSDVSNSKAVVELLIAHGSDLNKKDRQGQSLLHVAPTKDAAELLVANGLDVNIRRNDGATALHLAAVYERPDVVKVLINRGADVNARAKNGVSPLHYAKGEDVVKFLLASGAKVNLKDSSGNTPIYMVDDTSVLDLLLSHGAALNARNNAEQSPLLYMLRTYIKSMTEYGLADGPLGDPIVAAHGGSIKVIKALLDRGADVNLSDSEGYLPLFYVREAKGKRAYSAHIDELEAIEDLLITHGARLEKIKNKDDAPSQQNLSPELAGIPQIGLGTRVMMQAAIQYEIRQKTGKQNYLYHVEPDAPTLAIGSLVFDGHLQLLDYFQTLPAGTQKNGLWVKRMARPMWNQADMDRIDKLTQQARFEKVPLFLCEPTAPKNGSWLVTWECDQVSPQNRDLAISCAAVKQKGGTTGWECRNRNN